MIIEALFRTVVGSEAFAQGVVIGSDASSLPVVTLNTKVIVALGGEPTVPCRTFKQPLRQRNACGNAVLFHLFNGKVLVLSDVFKVGRVYFQLGLQLTGNKKQKACKQNFSEMEHGN